MKSRTEILVPIAAIQAVPIAVIAWYRLHRYAWYRYSAIVNQAYDAAGQAAIATYWGIGRRIVEEEQQGDERAKYGTHLITELAEKLIPIFGNNYSKRNLQHYRKFYILFPDYSKVYEFVHNLNWTHIS